jgi:hypothetical protein
MHTQTALFLYEKTQNPLLLDGIRALNDPKTPSVVVLSVKNHIESQFRSYLALHQNSGIELPYGLRSDQFDHPG